MAGLARCLERLQGHDQCPGAEDPPKAPCLRARRQSVRSKPMREAKDNIILFQIVEHQICFK